MREKYYGVYLMPPPDLAYAISLAHMVLAREFNTHTGSAFMAHCTVKGFTKLREGADLRELTARLDALFSDAQPFITDIQPPWVSSTGGSGESVLLWMSKDTAFQRVHDGVWRAVEPYVSPACRFTPRERHGDRFPPHITLVQSDLNPEPGIVVQASALCRYIYEGLPCKQFEARNFQLIEFESDDWDGAWWNTLTFQQIKGWTLVPHANAGNAPRPQIVP